MKNRQKLLFVLGLISFVLFALLTGCPNENELPKEVKSVTFTTAPIDVAALVNDATVWVTLATETEGATIYYTLDGTLPTVDSTNYTGPITVQTNNSAGETIKVKAIAFKEGLENSLLAEKSIVFNAVDVAAIEVDLQDVFPKLDEIVICIYEDANEYPAIIGLVAEDFTLVKDFNQPYQIIIEGFTLASIPLTTEYAMTLPGGENFSSGEYRLVFSKTGYSFEYIDFEIEDFLANEIEDLTDVIAYATTNKGTAVVSEDGTDIDPEVDWVTPEVMAAYTDAIATAQGVLDNIDATYEEVADAITDLDTATTTFNDAKAKGTKWANKSTLTGANLASVTQSVDGKGIVYGAIIVSLKY